MMPAMVDSCVFLDIFTQDAKWYAWSSNALAEAANCGTIIINPIIYAEISIRFDQIEELEALLSPDVFEYRAIPREAAFLAEKSFINYRRRDGQKTHPLPDFFIGAHAAIDRLDLITREVRRYREYYPSLHLICP